MKKFKLRLYFTILLWGVVFNFFAQVPFTAGNLVVLQIGDGTTATLSSAAYQEYYVELSPTTGVVQTVAIPSTTAGSRSVESGSASSDGDLNTSGDGKLLTFAGYDAATGTAGIASSSNNRVIGKIDNAGTITFPASFSGTATPIAYKTNNFRSAVTYDGTGFWTAGAGANVSSLSTGGIYYIASGTFLATQSTSTRLNNANCLNARTVKIFNNQLYGNANSSTTGTYQDPFTIGTGLPTTSSQTYTVLNGLPNTNDSYGFVMFDRDNNGVLDLLYIADIGGTTVGAGGLFKFYWNGTAWTAAGSLTGNITGITGYLDCSGNPTVFVTTIPNPLSTGTTDNAIYSYNDATSNSTSISGALTTVGTFVNSAGNGYVWRGITMAPTTGSFNWTTGSTNLSGAYKSIIITGGTVTLTGNISASDSIYVGSGATLICGTKLIKGKKFVLASGATIKIGSTTGITASSPSGNVQTTCRSYSSGATYEYNGVSAQATGNGLPSSVYSLTINNSSATGVVTLTSATTVTYLATFTLGYLTTTSTNLLTIASTGFVTGSSSSSFANGPVRKVGNTSFIFPTGKSGQYAPISISSPSVVTDQFTAEYFYSNPDPTYNNTLKDPTIDHISTCEYWMLDRTAGTSNVSVELSWDTPRSCGVTDLTDLVVAHWDPNLATPIWKDMGNSFTSGGTTAGTVVSGVAVTSFSPFTLASISTLNPLPVELVSFSANLDKSKVDLNWTTSSETNNDYFTIERTKDGVNFEQIAIVDGSGNSTSSKDYATVDNFPFQGLSYYRLKQTDYDGNNKYSQMAPINLFDGLSVESVFPNPANEQLAIQFNKNLTQQIQITIIDCLGQKVYTSSNNTSSSNVVINISELAKGIYMLVIDGLESHYQQKIIKQ